VTFNVSPAPRLGHPLARFVITAGRSVHEMIWTILLVAIVVAEIVPAWARARIARGVA
jgi:hypothetical protein